VGAVVVGVLAGFNVAGPLWFQVILFSVLSVIAFWLFRERLLQLTQGGPRGSVDSFIGETAVVVEDIAINSMAKRNCAAPLGTRVTLETKL
jgi:membrane protein implicated in regulation of membrane protease activity